MELGLAAYARGVHAVVAIVGEIDLFTAPRLPEFVGTSYIAEASM